MPIGDSSEIVYRTNIDLEATLTSLMAKPPPGMKIEYEKGGAMPPGIAYLRYYGTSFKLGSAGGVQIHYRRTEDLEVLLRILRARAVYLDEDRTWKVRRRRLGRSMLVETVFELALNNQTKPSLVVNDLLQEQEIDLIPEKVKDRLDYASKKYLQQIGSKDFHR